MIMKLHTLHDLYLEQIMDLYSAEQQLVEALPAMEEAATDPELKQAFGDHLAETRTHVERLERIFGQLELKPSASTCEAMKGLIREGRQAISAEGEPEVRDAALIAAAQRVEHYEIAGYGTARTFASRLGHFESVDELQRTLDEEAEADRRLTRIAESAVNENAARS
jgi:ferritin-like metal-binding protein YciE